MPRATWRVPREGPSAADRFATSKAEVPAVGAGAAGTLESRRRAAGHGGEWSRRWKSMWEKRAVVSGAT